MEIKDLLAAGQLRTAITQTTEFVRNNPFDVDGRGLLVELLILAGELERADKQLDTIAYQHPQSIAGVALLRQLIRAETAREQFFLEGRMPEFIDKPSDSVQDLLRASILLREGDWREASSAYATAEEHRVPIKGSCNGVDFDDFRDLDDRTAEVLEVLTSNGKYYWLPVQMIRRIEFRPIERPLDYKWRRAHLETTREDLDGEVYIPGVYFNTDDSVDDAARLGRRTDWLGGENEPYRGIGQRMFLAGDNAYAVADIEELVFDHETAAH